MLTPGRRSRRSILTPSRGGNTSSRVSSPAPIVEKTQIVSETSQYKLQTVPHAVHSIARDVTKKSRVRVAGLATSLGYVADGNRVVVWQIGGSTKMFELLVPNNVFSVHLTQSGGAVVTTVMGEVVRWSRVDQTERYSVQHSLSAEGVVDTTLHHDNNTLLLLDNSHNVWVSDNSSLTQLNPGSALGGISRRVSTLFWTAPETMLGDARKVVSSGDVIFVVGSKGVQRIHGTAITWTVELQPLISNSCYNVNVIDAVAVDGALKCLVEVDGLLYITTLSSNHATVPCSVDNSIQLQTSDITNARLLLGPSDVGLIYTETECLIVTLTSGVGVPVTLNDDVLCAVQSPGGAAGDFHLVTRQQGVLRLIVKDVKAAVSNLNISACEENEFKPVEKKFLEAFKCFIEFNEAEEQAKLQDIVGCNDETLINKIISESADYLISSAPAADPRWGGADVSLPVTLALQIHERVRRLKGLIQFIVATGYFDNLAHTDLGLRILQYVEKSLVAQMFCNSGCALLRAAISESAALLKHDNTHISSEDIVFSKIKRIEVVYGALASAQNTVLSSKREEDSVIQDLFASVEVVQQTFDAVLSWRQQSEQLYQMALKSDSLTWCDSDDVRTMLTTQVVIALDTVLPDVNTEGRYQVLTVAASLVESVLTLYKNIIGRLPENDSKVATLQAEYERRRQALIQPFVEQRIFQIAFPLAEQFQHFPLLVEMCEETNDIAKLRSLSAANPGFAEVAYNWYLAKGKQSRLLTANVADPQKLSQFLTSQPYLKWIHQLGNKEYITAGETLAKLGSEENVFLSRKKTLLSLSKLSYLAEGVTPDNETVRCLNRQLETVTHQERMKPEVIENAGLLPDTMAPISTVDLIRLCLSENNPCLEEIDVKKCLDLLQCVAEDDTISNDTFQTLRLEVWSTVIRRDDWWKGCVSATPQQIDQTLFYRAVILALSCGLLVSHFLPGVDELLGVEVWRQHFQEEAHFNQFEYILRSGYEQMSTLGVVTA